MPLKTILLSLRLPFILLAVVCAFLGIAYAWSLGGPLSWGRMLLVAIGAVCAHGSVNMLNEYHDFKSGLDEKTTRTPFNGGSGGLQANPGAAPWVLGIALLLAGATVLIGVYFLTRGLWGIIPIGIAGLVVILLYTPVITRLPLLCLFTPGLSFGPLMIAGACYVLTETMQWSFLLAATPVFFLVNNLLLLNQFPDVEADKAAGRLTLPIWLGFRRSALVFSLFNALAFASIALGVVFRAFPVLSLAALLPGLLCIPAHRLAVSYNGFSATLIPALRNNVLANLLTPAILGMTFLLGGNP